MMLKQLLVLFVLNIDCVLSGFLNYSRSSNLDSFSQKLPRFLTFNTEENGDVEVELEFKVPFLHLPVKRAMDTMHMMGWGSALSGGHVPSANLNLAALGLGGAVIVGSALAVPLLTALFSKKNYGQSSHDHSHYKRRNDDISEMMQVIEKLLEEYNIDTSMCLQRILCRLTKSANINLQNGNPGSYDLIISGLSRNSIFNNLIQDTALQEAIDSARSNKNCLAKYKDCNISQKTIHMIVNKISALFSQSTYF